MNRQQTSDDKNYGPLLDEKFFEVVKDNNGKIIAK